MNWDPGRLTIAQVKQDMVSFRDRPNLWLAAIEKLTHDDRKGIKALYRQELRLYQEFQARLRRREEMMRWEQQLWKQGYTYVAGVDEAGRGPLAGPVVAAAVILPQKRLKLDIQDSKQLKPEERQSLYHLILEQAVDVSVGVVTPQVIDSINILQATFLAMRQAVTGLTCRPDIVLVDGKFSIKNCCIPQKPVVEGDKRCRVIAAASVVAKVYRDALMERLDRFFPCYGLAVNKGYGTSAHRAAIAAHGKSLIHRLSFSAGD